MLRIKDARVGSKPFASKRTAQLTVWDADSLGADFFLQGARYFVRFDSPPLSLSNVKPSVTDGGVREIGHQRHPQRLVEAPERGDYPRDEEGFEVESCRRRSAAGLRRKVQGN